MTNSSINDKVKITKREHEVWREWRMIKRMGVDRLGPIIGRWQYIIESEKGKISLVELPNYFRDGVTLWEILCQSGDLFDDTERFESYSAAEAAARRYLTE